SEQRPAKCRAGVGRRAARKSYHKLGRPSGVFRSTDAENAFGRPMRPRKIEISCRAEVRFRHGLLGTQYSVLSTRYSVLTRPLETPRLDPTTHHPSATIAFLRSRRLRR